MQNKLQPRINFSTGVSIAVSMVVGSGLFGLPGLILQQTSPGESILCWIVAATISFPLVYIFAYLGTMYPVAEGVTKYAEIAFGKWALYSASLLSCGALAIALPAFFIVIGSYLAELLKLPSEQYNGICAIFVIIFSTLVNLNGPEKASLMNKIVIPATLIITVCVTAIYLPKYYGENLRMFDSLKSGKISLHRIWVGAAIAFWAFEGWGNLSFGLEEFKNPAKMITKIYLTSYLIIVLIYIPFIWTFAAIASNGQINVTGLSGLQSLLGTGLVKKVLLFLISGILISNSISWVFGTSRIVYTTAGKGLLPKYIFRLNNNNLPVNSLVACAAYNCIAIILIIVFKIPTSQLFLLTTQNFIILYMVAIIAFLRSTKKRMHKLIGIAGLCGCCFLISGFSWHLVIPILFCLVGFYQYQKTQTSLSKA